MESQGSSTENGSTGAFGKIPGGMEESVMIPLLIHFYNRKNPLPNFGGTPCPVTPKCSTSGRFWELLCST